MTKLTLAVPSIGELNTVAEPKVDTALKEIEKVINGELEGTNNLKAEGVLEANLSKELQEKLVTNVGLVYATSGISLEGVSGKFYGMTGNTTTLTLPTPTANRIIGVFAGAGTTGIKVTASSGKIYGDYTNAATTVGIQSNQHLLVIASGTDWLILAGEPKREQKYIRKTFTKAEAEAGVEPSASRPAFVSIGPTSGLEFAAGSVTVEGEIIPNRGFNLGFWVQPGTKWITKVETTAMTVLL